ncbi:MAG: nucleotidyltransferase domain-containing protein [Melioribacteraceae bacterium]|nr:nucleotidyltransferase domain-containing protein [Melioribacteraceae bacterium]
MYQREDITNIINRFISLASKEFPVKSLYLFGSYARGNARDSSDIDIAFVSDKFEGKRFWDREKLGKYLIKSSYDLEVHPFRTEDFTEDDPFVKEIIKTGVRII